MSATCYQYCRTTDFENCSEMECLTTNDIKSVRTSAKVCEKNGTDFLKVKDNNVADPEASRKGGKEEACDRKRTCFAEVSGKLVLSESPSSYLNYVAYILNVCLHVHCTISILKVQERYRQ